MNLFPTDPSDLPDDILELIKKLGIKIPGADDPNRIPLTNEMAATIRNHHRMEHPLDLDPLGDSQIGLTRELDKLGAALMEEVNIQMDDILKQIILALTMVPLNILQRCTYEAALASERSGASPRDKVRAKTLWMLVEFAQKQSLLVADAYAGMTVAECDGKPVGVKIG